MAPAPCAAHKAQVPQHSLGCDQAAEIVQGILALKSSSEERWGVFCLVGFLPFFILFCFLFGFFWLVCWGFVLFCLFGWFFLI